MRGLKFAGGLALAVLLHAVAVRAWPDFARAVDLFLLATVFNAIGGGLLAGALGGAAAGLVGDALTGAAYGLHGFADTIVGYGTALLAQRLVVRRPTRIFLLFSLVAAGQQAILVGLVLLLWPDPSLPELPWVLGKVVTAGLAGMLLIALRDALLGRVKSWRRRRTSKLR